ncbi:hypothetical protein VNO77_27766 [Canavalia gladiata]|uniref:Uncharacterized protein n=1 Tax=Canavalia gladiata TaxID=3824 RepID=A0AAN9KV93_CANGL
MPYASLPRLDTGHRNELQFYEKLEIIGLPLLCHHRLEDVPLKQHPLWLSLAQLSSAFINHRGSFKGAWLTELGSFRAKDRAHATASHARCRRTHAKHVDAPPINQPLSKMWLLWSMFKAPSGWVLTLAFESEEDPGQESCLTRGLGRGTVITAETSLSLISVEDLNSSEHLEHIELKRRLFIIVRRANRTTTNNSPKAYQAIAASEFHAWRATGRAP